MTLHPVAHKMEDRAQLEKVETGYTVLPGQQGPLNKFCLETFV